MTECLQMAIEDYYAVHPNSELTAQWTTGDIIRAHRSASELQVVYSTSDNQESVDEEFPIVSHMGKQYWVCIQCRRRAVYLYKPLDKLLFRCRLCHNLTYRSVQERRKYQSLAKLLAKDSPVSVNQVERFLSSWGKK